MGKKKYGIIVLVFFWVNMSCLGLALDESKLIDITSKIVYFVDTSNALTFNELKQLPDHRMVRQLNSVFNITTPNTIWIKLEFEDTKEGSFLFFDSPSIDSIQYIDEFGRVYYQGELVKRGSKKINSLLPIFALPNNQKKYTAWLKINNPQRLTSIDIQVGQSGSVFATVELRLVIMVGFSFLMIAVFVVNLIVFMSSKSRLLLRFAAFNFFTFVFITISSGLFGFFPGDLLYYISPYTTMFLCFLMMSGILLSINILNTKRNFPVVYKFLMGLFGVNVACILLVLVGYGALAGQIAGPLGGIIIPFYIYSGYSAYRNKQEYALYYFIGWSIYYIVMIVIILSLFNVLELGSLFYYLTPSVSLIDFFLITATLVSKINTYDKEKKRIEKEALDFIKNQNLLLEKRVDERTMELQLLNEEIAAQNEELHSQKEQISGLNESLEKRVEARTVELQNTLSSLQLRNKDLENFSYVVSHNLRGPVATILGLVQVFNINDLSDPSNAKVMEFTKKAIENLDIVIRDLNYIISTRNEKSEGVRQINLEEVVNLITALLEKEIKDSGIKIEVNFSGGNTLTSVPTYLQNIFYNILSNAIKYRNQNVESFLKIDSRVERENLLVRFEDNGIGIDLVKNDVEKLFRMFQRFDETKEGKGLGLYLVKSQIEQLGGKITVKSELGVGTVFEVQIPLIHT